MNNIDGLEKAVHVLRAASLGGMPEVPANSENQVQHLADLITRNARSRRRQQLTVRVALMSAAAAVVLGFWLNRTGEAGAFASPRFEGASIIRNGTRSALGVDTPLAVGAELQTQAHGGVTVSMTTGTQLELEPNGRLEVRGLKRDQQFQLVSGGLSVQVHKLSDGERFRIFTPNTTVEVHGTKFRVLVDAAHPCAGSATEVEVTEGLVSVETAGQRLLLKPGERWPRVCTAPNGASPAASQAPAVNALTGSPPLAAAAPFAPIPAAAFTTVGSQPLIGSLLNARGEDHPGAPRARTAQSGNTTPSATTAAAIAAATSATTVAAATATPAPLEASSLAAQNDAFAAAVGQERRGDLLGSLAGYESFLKKYPKSPLAENATVGRLRMLSKTNPERAREAARHYLNAYPNGIGRALALKLIDASGVP